MKPPSASNLLYTLGRKATAIITEERLQKRNKARHSHQQIYISLLGARCQCFCFISVSLVCMCVSALFSLHVIFCSVQNSILISLVATKTCTAHVVSNSKSKVTLRIMNRNAMFHFLLFNTGFIECQYHKRCLPQSSNATAAYRRKVE